MDINALLRYTVERGASDLHLKVGNVPFVRIDGELYPGEFDVLTPADTELASTLLMSDHKKRRVRRDERSRPRLHARGGRPLPGQRLPPARRDRARDQACAKRRAHLRGAPHATGHRFTRRRAPRTRARDRPDRDRQDHDDRLDDRPHQQAPARPHRHDRGSDRGDARRPALDRAAARDRHRHRLVRERPAPRHPPGSRRDLRRRDPRPGLGRCRRSRRPRPAIS